MATETVVKTKRKHRATGKPRGGARPGAGRPKGSKNVLPMGAIKAIRTLNMRAPKDATEEQKAILAETEDAVLKVMRGKVHSSIATPVLKAAVTVREEIVGPIARQVNVEAKVGIGALLDEVAEVEREEKPVEPVEPKPLPEAKGPIIRKKAAETVVAAVAADTGLTKDEIWGE